MGKLSKEDQAVNELIEQLDNFWRDAEFLADKLYYVHKHYPHRMKDVRAALNGQLSYNLESNLLMLAQKEMIPEMVPDTSKVATVLSSLTVNEQKMYYNDKTSITTLDAKTGLEDYVNAFEMSSVQLDMAFDKDSGEIRDLDEQKQWLKAHNRQAKAKQVEPWQIMSISGQQGIRFNKNSFFTKDELLNLIEQLN